MSLAEQGLALATCDLHAKLLRTLMAKAELYGLIEKSPARKLKLFNPDTHVEHYLSPEQLQSLLDILRSDNNEPVAKLVLFMLSTSLRRSLGAVLL